MEFSKEDFLKREVRHLGLDDVRGIAGLVDQFGETAFQARNLSRAAKIYDHMLRDPDCSVILCLAGSLFSAGLKKLVYEMINADMVDAIVSTGALIVDQDFFEALGFRHYMGTPHVDDNVLRELHIDRIYDTYIDEDDLRICDETIGIIADSLQPRPYSSQEFIYEMGHYLNANARNPESVVLAAYKKDVPIFVPAFSDCSAGFGLVWHQWNREGKPHVTIDSVKDFLDLTRVKLLSKETGILMIGGGVPKNFTQDIVVCAEVLGYDLPMHKYAVQITVADERDGGLSGSTLKEASSWGKVDQSNEQMVYCEATIGMPLVVGYAWGKGASKGRKPREFAKQLRTKPMKI
ncbi:MAG: deoxyhypusine synthase [Candidatus Brocadiia bacterium]